jgi:hypothetical protein
MKNLIDETSAPGGNANPTIMADETVGISMRAGDQIQQEMGTQETASKTQQDAVYTRVDQYTLSVVQQLFPTPNKGLEFTAGILRYAQVVQNSLPGLEDLGQHVAVINVRTIRVLADLISWGYDTTHKYVTTFCALGLLRKVKQGADRLLVFPLERYVLPLNLQPLDSLIAKSRPKVQQFARQVKIRLGQLNPVALAQSGDTESAPFEANIVSHDYTLHQSLSGLLESEGIDSAISKRISKRIITEVLAKLYPSALKAIPAQFHQQAATGTFDGRGAASSVPQAQISSHSQARADTSRAESTSSQQKSTSSQATHPRTHGRATEYGYESTGEQTESTDTSEKSTPISASGRLSEAKVSSRGRLSHTHASSKPVMEETQTDRGEPSSPKVSPQSSIEDVQGEQERIRQQPKAAVYTLEEMYENIMTTWDLLTSYQYILRENLIDWEADGLPTQFIGDVYEEICNVNAEYKKRGMIVASRSFFLNVLEKRAIEKLAYDYQLDFVDVYNLILFRTNRERFMIANFPAKRPAPPVEEPQASASYCDTQQNQAIYSRGSYQPEYDESQSMYPSHTGEYSAKVEEYQPSVHSAVNEYRPLADLYADQYQPSADLDANEYQYPADQYTDEYQSSVDSRNGEYQTPVDSYANEYQTLVDLEESESTHHQPPVDFQHWQQSRPVDQSAQESTRAAQEQASAQEQAPPQLPIAEIIDRAALQDGLTRLRIPRALSKQNYTSEFLNVYVTYNIYNLFKIIFDDVTLRNDGKMFFAEIFDTARASAAKNWYNRLFSKCSSPENLLAAFVETIIDLHSRGNVTIQNPGGLFNKKVAQCEKTIGEATLESAKVYGELRYEDFVLEIARLASRESLGIN